MRKNEKRFAITDDNLFAQQKHNDFDTYIFLGPMSTGVHRFNRLELLSSIRVGPSLIACTGGPPCPPLIQTTAVRGGHGGPARTGYYASPISNYTPSSTMD